MIFVTLGTQDKSFKRLLKAIDKAIENKDIKEKVIVQAGYTKYESDNMEIFDYCGPRQFNQYLKEANLVISHGGVGSIIGALKHDKKVIAAPRLSKYKEHTNDHQIEIVKEFAKEGYILELKESSELGDVIKESKKFIPKKYVSNNKKLVARIENYIDDTNHISLFNRYRDLIIIVIILILMWLFL